MERLSCIVRLSFVFFYDGNVREREAGMLILLPNIF